MQWTIWPKSMNQRLTVQVVGCRKGRKDNTLKAQKLQTKEFNYLILLPQSAAKFSL